LSSHHPDGALAVLGWTPALDAAFADLGRPDLIPARVAAEHRGRLDLAGAAGALTGAPSGRLRHAAVTAADLPAVGDWVAADPATGVVHAVLPRRGGIARAAGDGRSEPQVLAGSELRLSIPACGLHDVPVRLLDQQTPSRFLLTIERLSIAQHRSLIAFLYCRPGQWDEGGVPEPLTFWRFLEAPFRMYPLAETR